MPRPTEDRARVLGPYWIASIQRWRLVVIHTPGAPRPKDRSSTFHYPIEEEALEAKRELEQRICNVTIGMAIEAYRVHLAEKETIGHAETVRRLKLFFPDHEMLIGRVTPERGRRWYDAFRTRTRGDGEPISVAYHRAALINARSLFTFCVDEIRWLRDNPLAKVKGVGKRKSGKRKPTGNELRAWYLFVWARVERGDQAALAVMLQLSLALRSSDVTRRLVRDVDLDGTQLIIEDGKTEKSNEPRLIPQQLQPHLRKLVAGRDGVEPLFKSERTDNGHHTDHWLWQSQERFCRLAKVPHFCPHALKGVSGTILAKRGAGQLVMEHLSHDQKSTTYRHYVDREIVEGAQAEQAFRVIAGGKR